MSGISRTEGAPWESKRGAFRRAGWIWLLLWGAAAGYFFVRPATPDAVAAAKASPPPPTYASATPEIQLKPIEQVRPGEQVMAIDPQTGRWGPHRVIRPLSHHYDGDLITIKTAGDRLEATGNHPFWVIAGAGLASRPAAADVPQKDQKPTALHGRWVEARHLQVGDLLLIRNGQTATVEELASRRAKLKVYNLEVADVHTYAVGQSGILVHNKALQIAPIKSAPSTILNLGGEGEVPGAINMNNLSAPIRPIAKITGSGPLVQADMLKPFPFQAESMDQVIANRVPAFDAAQRPAIAAEALRVLRSGGKIKIDASLPGWADTLKAAGFQNVGVAGGYVVGVKP